MTDHVALRKATLRGDSLALEVGSRTAEAWHSLSFLRATYPDFQSWYWGTVVPGIAYGERRLFVEKRGERLSGLVIAKRTDERKICTIWTRPDMRGRGVATRLVRDALEWLDTDRPLVTVPEETVRNFDRLFRVFGFEYRYAVARYYRDESVEHVFNGILLPGRVC